MKSNQNKFGLSAVQTEPTLPLRSFSLLTLCVAGREAGQTSPRPRQQQGPGAVGVVWRGIQEAGREGKIQETFLQVNPARPRYPARQRLRGLSLHRTQRPALHREDRDALGDGAGQHDVQGQVVLPSGGDRNLRQKV